MLCVGLIDDEENALDIAFVPICLRIKQVSNPMFQIGHKYICRYYRNDPELTVPRSCL